MERSEQRNQGQAGELQNQTVSMGPGEPEPGKPARLNAGPPGQESLEQGTSSSRTENVKRDKAPYPVIFTDLGLVPYAESYKLMEELKARVHKQDRPGYAVFLEHPHVITLGYSLKGDEGRSALKTSPEQLLAEGIEVFHVDRGGKATYHGPGQLVCYLVLSLRELGLGTKRYVGKLQEAVLGALRELGAKAELDPAYPGVWVKGAKVAAVGVRVEGRVTSHGFALNLDPDLSKFSHIVPCGIPDRPVTSLAKLGLDTNRDKVKTTLTRHLVKTLGLEPRPGETRAMFANKEKGED